MAEILEICIPLPSDEVEELLTICEALGTPMETYLTDVVTAALRAHRGRYQTRLANLAAIEAANAQKQVRIINPITRETVTFARAEPVRLEQIRERLPEPLPVEPQGEIGR